MIFLENKHFYKLTPEFSDGVIIKSLDFCIKSGFFTDLESLKFALIKQSYSLNAAY